MQIGQIDIKMAIVHLAWVAWMKLVVLGYQGETRVGYISELEYSLIEGQSSYNSYILQ